MASCLTCDHKVGGSIPCQAKATLLIRSKIVLYQLSSLQATIAKKFQVCCRVYNSEVTKSHPKGDDDDIKFSID